MKRLFITVQGIVQGVGFRPFVYNTALKYNLLGWVNNNSEGVYIDIQGNEAEVESFLKELTTNSPPLSKIEKITKEEKNLENYNDFSIKESERKENSITLISPDIATCQDCLNDIDDENGIRHRYPFTNCTNCGPRFSIIKTIPYDRDKTTMKKFTMCSHCNEEYKNPRDRRFHAQPNACNACGPHVFLLDKNYNAINPQCSEAHALNSDYAKIEWTADKLKEGAIFSIKGLTGFHLCCDALNNESVKLLRERKRRPHKPFAVMMKDLETIRKYCIVSNAEERILTGIKKPIVLLNLKNNACDSLPLSLAPGQNTLGVMLPYTPLHHLLFNCGVEVLVMTSANIHGLPLEYKNEVAFEHLHNIVDYFLMHNRDIHIPVDDSVTRVVKDKERIIRRARGYAPEPIVYEKTLPILASGSNMKNTFCIAKDNFLFLSQHNGDLENLETYNHYVNNIEHFKNIFLFSPSYIASDLHPEYYSTKYAEGTSLPMHQVQHHHAHIVSCMAENKVSEPVIGIAFDGTGYGTDETIWGGEFLICTLKNFSRAAHLKTTPLPGGEKAILEPWRMALSYLHQYSHLSDKELINFFSDEVCTIEQRKTLLKVLKKNINCVATSSMGRFFDAVSALTKICTKTSYEGQASMELEALIPADPTTEYYNYEIETKEALVLNPGEIILGILEDINIDVDPKVISAKFHNSIINAAVEISVKIRECYNINKVALSGGVFQNAYLLQNIIEGLEAEGFTLYSHSLIPSNDGGVALGQLIVTNEIFKGGL